MQTLYWLAFSVFACGAGFGLAVGHWLACRTITKVLTDVAKQAGGRQ